MSDDSNDGRVQVNYVNGYASLASFIASDADRSTAIYRRFDRLSARNLLHLQSELEELQELQDQFDKEDSRGTTSAKAGIRNLTLLKEKGQGSDEEAAAARKRLDLQKEIEEKLKSYSISDSR
jgi:hypothetical protein